MVIFRCEDKNKCGCGKEFDSKQKSEKVQEKDKRKAEKYKELGFDMLVIKEKEFKNDRENVKNRINDFVKNYEKKHSFLLT